MQHFYVKPFTKLVTVKNGVEVNICYSCNVAMLAMHAFSSLYSEKIDLAISVDSRLASGSGTVCAG